MAEGLVFGSRYRQECSLPHVVRTGPESHPTYYSVAIGLEADLSSSTSC
jgi:hypothetical protein